MGLRPKPLEVSADGGIGLTLLDLPSVIESAQSLEPLPASVARLATLVADEECDLREIVEVISFDQALTGNLLRRANSAASASRNPIRTVHEAVVRLGTGTVLALAMSATVSRRLSVAVPEYGLAEGDLWRHSVRAALAGEAVRSASKRPVPAEIGTAALLHDIGKLVLARYLGVRILDLLKMAQDFDGLSAVQSETAVLEVHHGELGGLVAQHWRLPETIIRAIAYHHTPEQIDDPMAWATRLADLLAHAVAEDPEEPNEPEAREHAMLELGIALDRWERLVATTAERYEQLSQRYSG